MRKILTVLISCMLLLLCACSVDIIDETTEKTTARTEATTATSAAASEEETTTAATTYASETEALIDEDGVYDSMEEVALYIHTYGHLPSNYITKAEARQLGWEGGSVEQYAPGMCIGGDRFGNYEGILPEGHEYRECDIGTLGQSGRGARRLIYSNDGLIYYTEDHYESFTLIYGEE